MTGGVSRVIGTSANAFLPLGVSRHLLEQDHGHECKGEII